MPLSLVVGAPTTARAFEQYADQVPRPATAMNAAGQTRPCITCHNNPDGGAGCVASGGTKPCLNPFGVQFRANGFRWSQELAAQDADSDGFTNGQELQDPTGTWSVGFEPPGVAAYVTRPGFDTFSPGQTDDDGDGFCWFGQDLDDSGDCLGAGENNGALDCDDDAASVNSGQSEVCNNTLDNDCNGLPTLQDPACESVVDRDGDGVCPLGEDNNGDQDCIDPGEDTGVVDCNDDAPTVFTGNTENCSDGIDNDCNDRADMFDDACRNDVDNDDDGYCPLGQDLNGDGDCLDDGEEIAVSDCNDMDPDQNPGETEICTTPVDNDCDGDAGFEDSECASLFDEDGDGFCPTGVDQNDNGNCTDAGENVPPFDCDDDDPTRHPNATERCTDDKDTDCDGDISLADEDCAGYLDGDGDSYCFVGFDLNGDGNCAGPGEEGGSSDCDDTRPEVVPAVGGTPTAEVCTDSLDNNCDGSTDAFDPECADHRDIDGDAWCEVGEDKNADGDCADSGEQAGITNAALRDAVVDDSTIFPGAPENCLDRKDNDQDGLIDEGPARFVGDYRDDGSACVSDTDGDSDGYCPIGQDINGDGDCLDTGENIGVSDCDDGDADRNPGAPELCRSLLDEDCDGQVDLFDDNCVHLLDRDGDGFCGMGVDDNSDGDCLDELEDRFGTDCNDQSQAINVRAQEICDDEIDNDCDGNIDIEDTQCTCSATLCDDGDPCTRDVCETANLCVHTPDPTCGDGGMSGSSDSSCRASESGRTPWALGLLLLAAVLHLRRRKDG